MDKRARVLKEIKDYLSTHEYVEIFDWKTRMSYFDWRLSETRIEKRKRGIGQRN